jgi:hypothetical protein
MSALPQLLCLSDALRTDLIRLPLGPATVQKRPLPSGLRE